MPHLSMRHQQVLSGGSDIPKRELSTTLAGRATPPCMVRAPPPLWNDHPSCVAIQHTPPCVSAGQPKRTVEWNRFDWEAKEDVAYDPGVISQFFRKHATL